ncbi:MAG: NAD(P)/FAD-dependent oxidoreductase [Crocinitomicaceae bacterium]|nr:NAD(P)/FAD-dependent oxidoreductase [Crocinitomicaceae bacterium]
MKTATIVGAGLVGSLWAVYLSKTGYKVTIIERRSDLRKEKLSAGKSINLALSVRGWKAFKKVGVEKEIESIAIPMHGRIMHSQKGELTYQPYGQEGQAIYSVSRGGINCKMMDIAENHGNASILFNSKCTNVDTVNGIVYFIDSLTGEAKEIKSDVIFAADGAFSAVRYNTLQKNDRFNFNQMYIDDGYREILLPANDDSSYKLDKSALHIWPRGRFMMIALPNEGGSFTCTLFMPHENHQYSFDKLNSKEKVTEFFRKIFPDFYDLVPNISEIWENHPLSSLSIIRCYPWTKDKVALMGDAAHATVPFYGQGMNSGFEDCTVLSELMDKHGDNWPAIFKEYEINRKPDGDALQDLSLDNYYVMRDHVADPQFLLQKKLELRIQSLFPDLYTPLYSQVSFSHTRYSEAYKNGKKQDKRIKEFMKVHDVKSLFESEQINEVIKKEFNKII